MQPLSGNQRPDLLTALMNMSLVVRLPRKMHLCRSSSNAPRLPSFLEMLQTRTFCSLLTRCTIPYACHAKRHLNIQKWSKPPVFFPTSLCGVLGFDSVPPRSSSSSSSAAASLLLTHTQLCHAPPFTHNFVTHHLLHTIFVTHHLSHTTLLPTIFHTPLCYPPSFTNHLSLFVTHHLSHHLYHKPSFTLCHTPSFTPSLSQTIFHSFSPHHLSHTIFVPHHLSLFVTHHLSHHLYHKPSFTLFHHTIFHTPSLFPTIFHTQLCRTPSCNLSHISRRTLHGRRGT